MSRILFLREAMSHAQMKLRLVPGELLSKLSWDQTELHLHTANAATIAAHAFCAAICRHGSKWMGRMGVSAKSLKA